MNQSNQQSKPGTQVDDDNKTLLNNNNNDTDSSGLKKLNLGYEATIIQCPFCHHKILTNISHSFSWHGLLISIVLFILLKFYSLVLIILVLLFTQNIQHNCSNCLNKLGTHTNFESFSLQDRVLVFRFLTFGVIVTKKHLLAVFSFLLSVILVFLCVKGVVNLESEEQRRSLMGVKTNEIPFEEFNDVFKNNRTLFWEKYYLKSFHWKGCIIQVKMLNFFLFKFQLELMLKMDADSTTKNPDLYAYIEKSFYDKNKVKMMNLTIGDEVEFNVTLHYKENLFGFKQPILIVKNITKTGNRRYIEPYVNEEGRYGLKGTRLENMVDKGKMIAGGRRKELK